MLTILYLIIPLSLLNKQYNVRKYYNSYASNYDNFYKEIQVKKYLSCIDNLIKPGCGWFVDLGGGTGILSEWCNFPFITFDISYSMLKKGLEKNRYFLPIACHIAQLPVRNQSLQRIFSFTSIQNLDNQQLFFQELKRIITLNGYGIITALAKLISNNDLIQWSNIANLASKEIAISIEDVACLITYD